MGLLTQQLWSGTERSGVGGTIAPLTAWVVGGSRPWPDRQHASGDLPDCIIIVRVTTGLTCIVKPVAFGLRLSVSSPPARYLGLGVGAPSGLPSGNPACIPPCPA